MLNRQQAIKRDLDVAKEWLTVRPNEEYTTTQPRREIACMAVFGWRQGPKPREIMPPCDVEYDSS